MLYPDTRNFGCENCKFYHPHNILHADAEICTPCDNWLESNPTPICPTQDLDLP